MAFKGWLRRNTQAPPPAPPFSVIPEEHDAVREPEPTPTEATAGWRDEVAEDRPVASAVETDLAADIRRIEELQGRGNVEDALEHALHFRERFPEHPFGHSTASILYLATGRPDDAERVADQAVKAFPDSIEILVAAIETAIARKDLQAGSGRLDALLHSFPEHPFTTRRAPTIRARLDALIAAAQGPELIEKARRTERAGDWHGAIGVWNEIEQIARHRRDALVGIARCLFSAGDLDQAESAGARALGAYPDDAEAWAIWAHVAQARHDWSSAAGRWERFSALAPDMRAFDGERARALAHVGRAGDAEQLLADAQAADPDSPALGVHLAVIAEIAGDWETAVERWDRAVARSPGEVNILNARGAAIWHRDLRRLSQPEHSAAPDAHSSASSMDEAELLRNQFLEFEGLTDNCEFGLTQRHYGAEPVGLLRFARVKPEQLIELLGNGFAPLGDLDHMKIKAERGEYVVFDDRGYYWMHSFISVNQIAPEKYLRQQGARIALLKRKLLAQLGAGGRVYVCKDSYSQISDDMLRRLHAALAEYGNNDLLGLRAATPDHPPGSVELLDHGIYIAYLSQLFQMNGLSAIDLESWAKIVPAVSAHRRARDEGIGSRPAPEDEAVATQAVARPADALVH